MRDKINLLNLVRSQELEENETGKIEGRGTELNSDPSRTIDVKMVPAKMERRKSATPNNTTEQRIARHRRNRSTMLKTATAANIEDITMRRRMSNSRGMSSLAGKKAGDEIASPTLASPTSTTDKLAEQARVYSEQNAIDSKLFANKHVRLPDFFKTQQQNEGWEDLAVTSDIIDYSRKTFNVTELVKEKTKESNLRLFHRVEPAKVPVRILSPPARKVAQKQYSTLPASFTNLHLNVRQEPERVDPLSKAPSEPRSIDIRMEQEQNVDPMDMTQREPTIYDPSRKESIPLQ